MRDRFFAASEAVLVSEDLIDKICHKAGEHLYDQYLHTKDTSHCSMRLIQFFEEGIQVRFIL
jgi:hypothetical protein